MKILILGGTVFLGRHLVAAALARGHELTLFHRGRSNPRPLGGVEHVKGDRTRDLAALRGRRWDAVIDTCGYTPGTVRESAQRLADAVEHYTFISSVSAYAAHPLAGIDEEAPTGTLTESELREAEAIDPGRRASAPSYGAMYGPLKALSEQAAEDAMPGRVLRIRPGLIVGPHDYSDRFTYWVRRLAEGGEVLAPGRPERRVRVIDARDLAEWTVRMAEAGATGIYNATGPARGSTMSEVLDACQAVSGNHASFTWVDEPFLIEHEVRPWIELPLWLPEEYNGIFEIRNDKAIAAGLTFRALAETARDTLAWSRTAPSDAEWNAGLEPEREAKLLRLFAEF